MRITCVFLSSLLTLTLAGTVREMVPGEITPVSAEQSSTVESKVAGNAIDRDTSTYSWAVAGSDGKTWLKVTLGQVYCIDKVVVYYSSSYSYSYSCSLDECTCEGNCWGYLLSVYTESTTSSGNIQPTTGCKQGDTVKVYREDGGSILVFELEITAKLVCSGFDPSWTALKTTATFPTAADTEIQVSCWTGYRHQGDSTVICVKGTQFSFTSKPNCVAGKCTTLDSTWENVVTNPQLPVEHGTAITLGCTAGHVNIGGGQATCQYGQLVPTDEPPLCRANCSALDSTWENVVADPQLPVEHGTAITFGCTAGHVNIGGGQATCQNGTIIPTDEPPLCRAMCQDSNMVHTIRAITFKEARDAFVKQLKRAGGPHPNLFSRKWISKKINQSETFVTTNWNRDPYDLDD